MLYKYIRITYHQTDRIAAICADLGIVFIASIFIPTLLDGTSIVTAISGLGLASFFGTISILLSK